MDTHLDSAEVARILWEQAETAERASRALTELAARMGHEARRFAVALVEGEAADPRPVLRAQGAVAALAAQVREADEALADATEELRVSLAPDPDSEVAVRAREELIRRLSARRR